MIQDNRVSIFLLGNKDETPTKLNVSSSNTVDMKGIADVRHRDQGQLKSQYTTYAGGWAGAMKTKRELSDAKPMTITINDFTKDGHLLPSLSIFKGKTTCTLANVMVETCCFDAAYSAYLAVRPNEVCVRFQPSSYN